MPEQFDLMYDLQQRKVGCVLVQAGFGCDPSLVNEFGFHTESWLLFPTPNLHRMTATREQWEWVAKMSNQNAICGVKVNDSSQTHR